MTTVIATSMWIVGGLLALGAVFVNLDIGPAGIVIAAGAATVTVRGFFCRLVQRDRNAFELGRDYETGRVRSIK